MKNLLKKIVKPFIAAPKDDGLRVIRLDTVDSTNRYLRQYQPSEDEEMTLVVADNQTAGRGQGTNSWESEAGKNLLFSLLVHPTMLPVNRQFMLSEAHALALREALSGYADGFMVKWPNDIYYHDSKISGTLIETKLSSRGIGSFILGTGINVNQQKFMSDAPNPVSLRQILGHDVDRDELMNAVIKAFKKYYRLIVNGDYGTLSALYHEYLYRRHGFYPYQDARGEFVAAIVEVQDDGLLVLRDKEGRVNTYEFKEVKAVIKTEK